MRGGLSTPETLWKTALRHFDTESVFAISCRSKPDMTADELASVEPPTLGLWLRETTVGTLRGAGYNVVPDEPPPAHALVMLPAVPADDDYLRVSAIFGDQRPNPTFKKEPK